RTLIARCASVRDGRSARYTHNPAHTSPCASRVRGPYPEPRIVDEAWLASARSRNGPRLMQRAGPVSKAVVSSVGVELEFESGGVARGGVSLGDAVGAVGMAGGGSFSLAS